MVADGLAGHRPPCDPGVDVVHLDEGDVPAMRALVARTEPGPFERRTHTLGTFVGVKVAGRLVAMAGTRLHTGAQREISAVCTDADHRGRGLATLLVSRVVDDIRERGETPFLHAAAWNTGAIRLYAKLGFEPRRQVLFLGVTAPSGR